jgi:hypothetical protein
LLIVFVTQLLGKFHYWGVDYGKRCETREGIIQIVNSRALASFPDNQLPRNSSGIILGKRCESSGVDNLYYLFPCLASFPVFNSRGIVSNNSRELFTGKDARARELTIFINFSRDPHFFPYSATEYRSFPVTLLLRCFSKNVSRVIYGKRWEISGVDNVYYLFPSLASFPESNSRRILTNNSRELLLGKRCETREKIIKIVNSRGLASFPENNYREIPRELTSGKDARPREKVINIVNSRDLASFPVLTPEEF